LHHIPVTHLSNAPSHITTSDMIIVYFKDLLTYHKVRRNIHYYVENQTHRLTQTIRVAAHSCSAYTICRDDTHLA
jgi:hypothetical protein